MTNMVVRRRAQVNPWNEIDKAWDSFYRASDEPRKPVVQINNEESKVTLTAELPGFGPEDIDIQVKENLLTVQAFRITEIKAEIEGEKAEEERKIIFEKSFVLPDDLNRDNFEAEMKNGLLTLDLPRKEKAAPRSIKVKA
ncbi:MULTISPECIES: Hsp20/alpha crystallin family protein [unclassified Oceanispirochaeta]|uniref:Hsp20/alpha crystallin family protein n=1 Tax=unclassified Oceanispirochaeta TaxID=2635722 RepID=UPI001314915D|nr:MULTISPECIES: Hsp20/alpha crystallin family protein [unclassified Oceanispirochaeta]MBF9014516.1 Hsp20/alpha crystallin family protein [Oceanispirochaeta sp. M2]NPD70772.1 Hsp20/alpha crystallin family protein [Oceanispirochaeta sp. M1]